MTDDPSGTGATSIKCTIWHRFQLPRTEEPSGTAEFVVRLSTGGAKFQLPRTEEASGTSPPVYRRDAAAGSFNFPGRKNHPEPAALAGRDSAYDGFQLPRTEEPSGTRPVALFTSTAAKFQLPRTEEPSGTRAINTGPDAAGVVSTSPDGRTIRNLGAYAFLRALGLFQLPRTEEPSGTPSGAAGGDRPAQVSTSPDGRTIRNLEPLPNVLIGW